MKPSHLKEVLRIAIESSIEAVKARQNGEETEAPLGGLPLLIVGPPGVGKSDLVAQACADLGAKLIISHPVVSDPVDYKGLPFVVDGKAEFMPFGELQELIDASEPTVFFLDDLGQAPASVQAAAMQLLLARRINGHKVSDHVVFVAATNRREDKAGVSGVLEPVKSRFAAIINLEPDLEDWVKWALAQEVPTELVAFLRFRPDLLHDFKPSRDMVNSPCPRTAANVGKLLKVGLPSELEYEVITGAAGEGFAAEFLGFLRIFRSLPNPDLVLQDPEAAEVPEDPSTLYALCGALANKATDKNMDNLVAYANRIPAEFSVLMVRDAINRDGDLVNTTGFVTWASKHSSVVL